MAFGGVINPHTSAIALGSSADFLWIPTAIVKAMLAFWFFCDHGHSAEFVQQIKGESIIVRHTSGISHKTKSLSTLLQPKYSQQNHLDVPTKQVPSWSPTTRMSSIDDRQKWYLPKGNGTKMTSSDYQDRPRRMSLNAQRRNKLIKFLLLTKFSVTVSIPVTLITTVFALSGVACRWFEWSDHQTVVDQQGDQGCERKMGS